MNLPANDTAELAGTRPMREWITCEIG